MSDRKQPRSKPLTPERICRWIERCPDLHAMCAIRDAVDNTIADGSVRFELDSRERYLLELIRRQLPEANSDEAALTVALRIAVEHIEGRNVVAVPLIR